MTRKTFRRFSLALAMTAAPVAFLAAPAVAGSASGNCALNMVNSHTWPGGMEHAMSVNNPNGTAGMFVAVGNSC
jgi:hypothetical protein